MFKRNFLIVLSLHILLISRGCQYDKSSSISVTFDTPPPASPTEIPTTLRKKSVISVPVGKPLAIDGSMSPGEWDSAVIETFSDGSELFLMYSDGYLYLGVQANTPEMIEVVGENWTVL